jgi:hypothetical protein
MNKKSNSNRRDPKANGLSIKRETIRTLSPAESALIAGGQKCRSPDSCVGGSCPNSVCTITLDKTI